VPRSKNSKPAKGQLAKKKLVKPVVIQEVPARPQLRVPRSLREREGTIDELCSRIIEGLQDRGFANLYPRPLTKRELARWLSVSERWLDDAVRFRRIPFFRIGPLIRFDLAKVEKALHRSERKEVC